MARTQRKPARTRRRERPAELVTVYMLVDRKTRKPLAVFLRRDDARLSRGDHEAVIRCEVVKAKRAGGGA